MDVGVELRELRASGRLGAFARALGVNTHEALGVLCDVWHETQHREIVLVTEPQFTEATGLVLLHDPRIVLAAMVAAQLATPADPEKWLIRGNDRHVEKLKKYRASASIGGKRSVEVRQATGKRSLKQSVERPLEDRSTQTQANVKPSRSDLEPWILDTGIDHDLDPSDPNITAQPKSADPRSPVSSDAKNEIVLSASPSAAADALSVLDLPKPKRKERSPDQKRRSVANARLYCELYEHAEGHPPSGLDASFYGAMAKFSDKHAEGAEQILRWVFEHCPDKSFRNKGWPLPLVIEQAPRLWRELNNPRAAVENIAAPRQQQQLALAAANEMAFTEFLARHGEVPNATR